MTSWTFAIESGPGGLAALMPAWRELADRIPSLDVVQTPEWSKAYLDHLAPAPEAVSWVTARQRGQLVAVLPLEPSRQRPGELHLLVHPHMTLADVAARPEAGALWPALWNWLQNESGLRWHCLVIDRISADAVLAGWLAGASCPLAIPAQIDGCALLDCDRSFDALLRSASANHRSSLGRGLKRAGQMGTLRYTTHADPQGLSEAMPRFLEIEASGWKGRQGGAVACADELIRFYTQLAQDLGAQGRCEIDLLWLDERAIATVFWFRTGGQLHLQKIAYLEDLAAIGPGKLIMREALMRACADPTLRGVSFITRCAWADGWRTRVTPVWSHTLYRESLQGQALFLMRRQARRAKSTVKHWLSVLRPAAPAPANVKAGMPAGE